MKDEIIRKSNKYVYLKSGKHMTHQDYHKYMVELRGEENAQFVLMTKDSVHMQLVDINAYTTAVMNLKDIRDKLSEEVDTLQERVQMLEMDVNYKTAQQDTDWEAEFRRVVKESDEKERKFLEKARQLYGDFTLMRTREDYTTPTFGIKFIIQEHENGTTRFRFDPYGVVSNGHSAISNLFRDNYWGTKNGGWIQVFDKKVFLYATSGDYGTFDAHTAHMAAIHVFPIEFNIHSHPGLAWGEVKALYTDEWEVF